MQYYFKLQMKRIDRWFTTIGLPFAWGLVLGIILFTIGSFALFYKTEFAPMLYVLIALMLLGTHAQSMAVQQSKRLFTSNQYYQIRLIENGLILLPFIIFLLYQQQSTVALGLLLCGLLFAFFGKAYVFPFVLPTPFARKPFEYIVGFRKTWALLILAYFIFFQALQVDNFNLVLGTIGLLFLIHASYYVQAEPEIYLWNYNKSASAFLRHKIDFALSNALVCSLPMLLISLLYYSERLPILAAIFGVGLLVVLLLVLAKYSAYPKEMNVPQGILIAMSIGFPPFLLISIPLFYRQAKKRLIPYFI